MGRRLPDQVFVILVLKIGAGKEKQEHIFLALEEKWEQIQVNLKASCLSYDCISNVKSCFELI